MSGTAAVEYDLAGYTGKGFHSGINERPYNEGKDIRPAVISTKGGETFVLLIPSRSLRLCARRIISYVLTCPGMKKKALK